MISHANRDKKTSVLLQLAICMFLLNSLCKYFFPTEVTKLLPVMALGCAVLDNKRKIKFSIKNVDVLFFGFSIIWFIGCIYSPYFQKGFGFVLSFLLSLIFGMLVCVRKFDIRKTVSFIGFFCTVFSMLVICEPLVPDVISKIVSYLPYTYDQVYEMNYWSARLGMYSGIFPDRAPAAFFSSLLIGCGLYFLYNSRSDITTKLQKITGFVFIAVGCLSLLMTAKRGHLVASALASLATFIVYKRSKHKSVIKILIGTAILGIAGAYIFINIDASRVVLERFTDNDNFFTNRLDIYDHIYMSIRQKPLFGTGTASANEILGVGGHNIYLTVFMENGIFGFIIFVLCVLCSVFYSLKVIYRQSQAHCYDYLPGLLFALFVQLFFVVYGFSGNPLYDNYIFYIYIFSLAIVKNSDIMYKKTSLNMVAKE